MHSKQKVSTYLYNISVNKLKLQIHFFLKYKQQMCFKAEYNTNSKIPYLFTLKYNNLKIIN